MTEKDVEQIIETIEESDDLAALAKVAKAVATHIQGLIKQRQ
ncbi:hypothetical protein [Romeriopsis navalis]|nr:hypothetical protein [Romeriopsis navalis]